jgi:hypothetical protein
MLDGGAHAWGWKARSIHPGEGIKLVRRPLIVGDRPGGGGFVRSLGEDRAGGGFHDGFYDLLPSNQVFL